jgi:solute carrier family 13 (sodium-dependent dicarboxylate transporter), member 2/3/5
LRDERHVGIRKVKSEDFLGTTKQLDGSTPALALSSTRMLIGGVLSVGLPCALWFAPFRMDLTEKHALAVASFMIITWITEVLPHAVTGIIGCYLFWVLKIVGFETAFSGFADQTPWFLFGAGLIGMMATKSGLARRLAYMVTEKVGAGYSRLLLGFILSSFLLTFLVPSGIACVIIMAAVAVGVMDVFGLGRGSNVGRGIFVTLTCTAGTFDKMVIAGATSILGRGLIEKITGIQVYWSQWLLAFFPCAVVTIFFTWRLVVWMYPPEKEALEGGEKFLREALAEMGPWSRAEKKSMLLMLIAIALWSTDLITHISPAIIGIGIGLLATVPALGVLDQEDLKRLNYLPVFFTAAAIGMGNVLVQTKALNAMTAIMFDWMRPWVTNVYSIAVVPYWTAFCYHIFLGNEISMLATSMPPLLNFAESSGLHPLPIAMVWAFASGGKIFVYQSGVMVAGYSYGYFKAVDLLRVGLCLTVVESLVLLLVVPFYWPLIGIR